MWPSVHFAWSHSHSSESNLNVISHQGCRQHPSNIHTLFIVSKILPLVCMPVMTTMITNKRYVLLNVAIVLCIVASRVYLMHYNEWILYWKKVQAAWYEHARIHKKAAENPNKKANKQQTWKTWFFNIYMLFWCLEY